MLFPSTIEHFQGITINYDGFSRNVDDSFQLESNNVQNAYLLIYFNL